LAGGAAAGDTDTRLAHGPAGTIAVTYPPLPGSDATLDCRLSAMPSPFASPPLGAASSAALLTPSPSSSSAGRLMNIAPQPVCIVLDALALLAPPKPTHAYAA